MFGGCSCCVGCEASQVNAGNQVTPCSDRKSCVKYLEYVERRQSARDAEREARKVYRDLYFTRVSRKHRGR